MKHGVDWPSQSSDLNPVKHGFYLLKTTLKGETQQSRQQLNSAVVKARKGITNEGTSHLVMSTGPVSQEDHVISLTPLIRSEGYAITNEIFLTSVKLKTFNSNTLVHFLFFFIQKICINKF